MRYGSNTIRNLLLGMALSAVTTLGSADSDLCQPFKNAVVDQSVVARMLESAADGHLYRIESSTSQMGFCVDSSVGNVKGQFRDFKGGLTFVPASAGDQQAMVMVNTDSIQTDAPLIEELLKGENFFDVKKFPEILFVSREFHWMDKQEAILIGDLTMHGVTRQVGFHVQLLDVDGAGQADGGKRIRVKATTLISRSEFGLNALSKMVSDAVSLCMSVEAVRYRAT